MHGIIEESGIDIEQVAKKIIKKLKYDARAIREYLFEKRIILEKRKLSHTDELARDPILFCLLVDEINDMLATNV